MDNQDQTTRIESNIDHSYLKKMILTRYFSHIFLAFGFNYYACHQSSISGDKGDCRDDRNLVSCLARHFSPS